MRTKRWAAIAVVTMVVIVSGAFALEPPPAGAAEFGPVDHTLADGATGSLRDIVENQATNQGPGGAGCVPTLATCGDTVELEPGQTYTLTCLGGGPLAHGNTPLRLVSFGAVPATIDQTCPGNRILDQGGNEIVTLENVVLIGDAGGQMSPPCFSAGVGPTEQRSWSITISRHTTRVDLPPRDEFETRVLGVVTGGTPPAQVVFDQTTANPASSPEAQALFDQAAAAVEARAGDAGSPELVDAADSSTTTHQGDVFSGHAVETSPTTVFGPATILVGNDQSEFLFVPLGCTNRNDHTHTSSFFDSEFQTTVTHSETHQITGRLVAADPVVASPSFAG